MSNNVKRVVTILALTGTVSAAPALSPASAQQQFFGGCPPQFMPAIDLTGLPIAEDRNGDGQVCLAYTEGGPIYIDNILAGASTR